MRCCDGPMFSVFPLLGYLSLYSCGPQNSLARLLDIQKYLSRPFLQKVPCLPGSSAGHPFTQHLCKSSFSRILSYSEWLREILDNWKKLLGTSTGRICLTLALVPDADVSAKPGQGMFISYIMSRASSPCVKGALCMGTREKGVRTGGQQ